MNFTFFFWEREGRNKVESGFEGKRAVGSRCLDGSSIELGLSSIPDGDKVNFVYKRGVWQMERSGFTKLHRFVWDRISPKNYRLALIF